MGAINNFITQMSKSGGYARSSQYELILNLPGGVVNATQRSQSLTLNCETLSWPGHDLQTQSRKHGNEPERYLVQSHGFEGTITASFYLSMNHSERFLLEQWQELAVNRFTHKANYYDDYIGSMEIHQLSSTGALTAGIAGLNVTFAGEGLGRITGDSTEMTTYAIKALEVYPATVGDIEYSYDSGNQISKLSVGFAFKQWVRIK